MSATFDATTTAEYAAATTAEARSAVIVAALTGTISVKVFNGSNVEKGSGTMAAPWAAASDATVTVGEVSSFTVGGTATPDVNWYIRFQNADVSRWVRGSFGLSDSGQDFTWSLATWEAGQTGTIGTATITTTGNSAPVFTVAPTTASISSAGGTIQFTAIDAENETIIYSLTTTRNGVTINSSTGLVTVTAAAAGTSGNIVVSATDGILPVTTTCAVTVASANQTADFIIPASTSARTINGASTTAYGATTWASLATGSKTIPAAGDIVEFASGVHAKVKLANFTGSPTKAITIRPAQSGTKTTFRQPSRSTGYFMVEMNRCRYVHFSGYRSDLSANRYCGFYMTHSTDVSATSADAPTAWIQVNNVSKFVEISYVEIFGGGMSTNPAMSQTSISIQVNDHVNNIRRLYPGQWVEGIKLHNNWAHEAGGFYVGANYEMKDDAGNWYPDYSYLELPLRDITIEHNLIEYPRQEGIGGKMWWDGDNYIRYNTIHHTGQASASVTPPQRECMSIQGTATVSHNLFYASNIDNRPVQTPPTAIFCRCDNGPVEGQIYSGYNDNQPYTHFPLRIFNNVVYRGSKHGISINNEVGSEQDQAGRDSVRFLASVYNNTIVGFDSYGIYTQNVYPGSFAKNNVIRDNALGQVYGSLASASDNNLSAAVTGFVDATNSDLALRDYHLTSAIPVASSSSLGTNVALDDIDGVARTLANADMGAYEKT